MVIAVADRVILEHELARERSLTVERHGRRLCKLLVGQGPDGGRRGGAVLTYQIDRGFPGDAGVFCRMPGVHLVDVVGRHACNGLALGERLGQLDLYRVDTRDVMHDHADCPPILRHAGLPLRVRETARERDQRAGALLEPVGEGGGTLGGDTGRCGGG